MRFVGINEEVELMEERRSYKIVILESEKVVARQWRRYWAGQKVYLEFSI